MSAELHAEHRGPHKQSTMHTSRRRLPDVSGWRTPPSAETTIRVVQGHLTDYANEPCISHNAASAWRAIERWSSPEALVAHYGSITFSLPSGTHMSLSEFLEYSRRADTDFPQYLVETSFVGERQELLKDYSQPAAFADALDDVPGTQSRPHWFVGGARTGSLMHQDTRCSCGWNVCLFGCKRWLMLPPETDVTALGLLPYNEGPACWFADHLAQLQHASAAGHIRLYECVQRAGDLVYIPAGWHHTVVNLELSCAIAHTLVTPTTLPLAWKFLRTRWPAFALSLRELLECSRPALAECRSQPRGTPANFRGRTTSIHFRGLLRKAPAAAVLASPWAMLTTVAVLPAP